MLGLLQVLASLLQITVQQTTLTRSESFKYSVYHYRHLL